LFFAKKVARSHQNRKVRGSETSNMSQQNFKRKWSREGESSGDEENDGKIIGSFSLKEVKSSEDYLRRIETSDAKKRKWALNFGYLGSKYQGLQMNPGRVYLGCHVSFERMFVAHLFLKETVSVLSLSKSQVNLFVPHFFHFFPRYRF
jgi:hypothetical protein